MSTPLMTGNWVGGADARGMGDRNRAANRELQRRKARRGPRNATGYHGVMNQYNEAEFNNLRARYAAGERFEPGSPEDQKLVNWANIDSYRARRNNRGRGPEAPPPPTATPEAPAAPAQPGMPPDTQPMPGDTVGYEEGASVQPLPGEPAAAPATPPPPEYGGIQSFMGQFAGGQEAYTPNAMPDSPPQAAPAPAPAAATSALPAPPGGGTPNPAPAGMAFNTAAGMPVQPQAQTTGTVAAASMPQQHTIDINVSDETNQMNQPMPIPPLGGQNQLQGQPYPQPAPPTAAPSGPYDPYQNAPPAPVPPAQQAPALGYPPGSNMPEAPGSASVGGPAKAPIRNWSGWGPSETNEYGGQQIAGNQPDQADYNSVQGYADAAHENAMRYLKPQIDQQNRRFEQQLINKGIDPMSPQGQEMAAQLGRQQADASNAAAFGALGFGQGIQNQMFGQSQAQSQLAGDMQKALWQNQLGASGQSLQAHLGNQQAQLQNAQMQNQFNLGKAGLQNQYNLGMAGIGNQRYGQDLQYNLGRSGQDLQRYGMDLNNQLGQGQLDLGRQQQNWGELSDMQDWNFRDQSYGDQQQRMDDAMLYQLLMSNQGFNPAAVSGGGQFTGQSGPSGFGNFLNMATGLIPGM